MHRPSSSYSSSFSCASAQSKQRKAAHQQEILPPGLVPSDKTGIHRGYLWFIIPDSKYFVGGGGDLYMEEGSPRGPTGSKHAALKNKRRAKASSPARNPAQWLQLTFPAITPSAAIKGRGGRRPPSDEEPKHLLNECSANYTLAYCTIIHTR